ncbi:unnamed protein product, partial [Didymodactylos carnosus]
LISSPNAGGWTHKQRPSWQAPTLSNLAKNTNRIYPSSSSSVASSVASVKSTARSTNSIAFKFDKRSVDENNFRQGTVGRSITEQGTKKFCTTKVKWAIGIVIGLLVLGGCIGGAVVGVTLAAASGGSTTTTTVSPVFAGTTITTTIATVLTSTLISTTISTTSVTMASTITIAATTTAATTTAATTTAATTISTTAGPICSATYVTMLWTASNVAASAWIQKNYTFTATQSQHSICFNLQNYGQWNLDDVFVSSNTTNLIVNSGFETGSYTPAWSMCGLCSTNDWTIDSTSMHSGSYSFKTVCGAPSAWLSQQFSTTVGTVYSVSFWAKNVWQTSPTIDIHIG